MSQKKPGKTREKLAEILREALPDIDVRPEDLFEARGWYRTDIRADVFRWEAIARLRDQPNIIVSFGSYSTMTECVKNGISMSREGLEISVEAAGDIPKRRVEKLKDFRML